MGMKSDERYDASKAYDKKLSSSARMHYLENDIADRKGHSGSYSGNHPRYSSPTTMMGQVGAIGQTGAMGQAQANEAYNPVEDIAGQGTEGINAAAMKGNSPFQNASKGYGQQLGKPSVATMYGKKK